jgi:hypothetical protein
MPATKEITESIIYNYVRFSDIAQRYTQTSEIRKVSLAYFKASAVYVRGLPQRYNIQQLQQIERLNLLVY